MVVALFFSLPSPPSITGPLKNVPSPSGCRSTEGSRPARSQYLKEGQAWSEMGPPPLLPHRQGLPKPHYCVPAQPPASV